MTDGVDRVSDHVGRISESWSDEARIAAAAARKAKPHPFHAEVVQKLGGLPGEVREYGRNGVLVLPKTEHLPDPDDTPEDHALEISSGHSHGSSFVSKEPGSEESEKVGSLDEAIGHVRRHLIQMEINRPEARARRATMGNIQARGRAMKAHNERLHRGGI